ncbi:MULTISPECIES: hypothetical protein [Microbacterium]|uniref:Uncharacterized protein n=1 Tax=Microbacterium hominis TaxID=162426 RepID=A0A2K9D780_9MICO|nr:MULTISPECIES: hypothetical protein [Microbacterium]AUG29450.1 hypothetical protein CXR34_08220 [Microbacterium hominis]EPD84147.1 hypothetical protein HMPREF1529_02187 [Microbacterium sp. oral taxon 186 str. F0373]
MTIIDKLDRAHRMSCSDPDDLTRTTLYSEARDALRAAQPRVLSVAETLAGDPALDQIAARDAVAALLDELPDGALVQVVEVNEIKADWTIRQRSYYERFGRGWSLLDPSDRNDGEDTFDSRQVAAASIHYGAARRENGFIRVLFVPAEDDQ